MLCKDTHCARPLSAVYHVCVCIILSNFWPQEAYCKVYNIWCNMQSGLGEFSIVDSIGAFFRRSYSYCWLDCGGPTSNSHNSHNIKSSTFNDSPLLFHIWMESPQFFKLLLKWGWINGSCLEPRPEGRVKGIPPVWRHWQPQRNHPKSLTGTHNPPLVQDLLTMFLECIWPYYSTRYQYMLSTDTL